MTDLDRLAPVRVGIIGTGFAAECHADALRRVPSVQLVGIASRSRSRARAAAQRFGIEQAFDDPLALIEDPWVDAVHICTINRLHAELSLAALGAGKHVVTEKPLATDAASAETLATAGEHASATGTLSAVCFNYRHYSVIQQLREMLASGEHGPIHFVHGSYLQDWLLHDSDWNWRLDPADNGASRAVADIGSHWIDLVQFVTGLRVSEVFADLVTHHPTRRRPAQQSASFDASDDHGRGRVAVESEDFGSVMLRFDTGARGVLAVSQVSPGRKNRLAFEIDTSQAAVAWDQEHPDRAWVGRRGSPNLECVRDPTLGRPGQLPAGHPEGWADALRNLCADFYSAVHARRAGREHPADFATFSDGHRITQLVEAIVESHRMSSWVGLSATNEVPG